MLGLSVDFLGSTTKSQKCDGTVCGRAIAVRSQSSRPRWAARNSALSKHGPLFSPRACLLLPQSESRRGALRGLRVCSQSHDSREPSTTPTHRQWSALRLAYTRYSTLSSVYCGTVYPTDVRTDIHMDIHTLPHILYDEDIVSPHTAVSNEHLPLATKRRANPT